MSLKSIATLYLREYPRLLRQAERLRELVASGDSNVSLMALFGSTVRFEPRGGSDADLLILTHDPRDYSASPNRGSWLIIEAQDEGDDACLWPLSAVVSDADASDLDPDFLAEVAREGVLLYLQDGARVPDALAGLHPYDDWLREVEAELAECRAVLALPPVEQQAAASA